jgi:hypothetical protein
MAITKDQRKKLLKILPKNYREILAKRENVHPQTIGNCLYGRTENKSIEIALLVLAQEAKEVAMREEEEKDRIIKQL